MQESHNTPLAAVVQENTIAIHNLTAVTQSHTQAINELTEDVKDIRQEMREMRAENKAAHEDIKRHFDVVFEGLNSTIMLLAEQIREDRRERNSLVSRVDRLESNDSMTQMRLGVIERSLKTGLGGWSIPTQKAA